MLKHNPPPHSQIVSLTLAFLLTGLFGCSKGSAGEQAAGAPKPPATPPQSAPAQAGSPTASAGPAPAAGLPQTQPGAPAATAPAAPPLDTAKLPAVVAKVNGVEVKKDELVKEAQGMQSQMGGPGTADANFYKQVLDGIITRLLLLQDAKAQGVIVNDDEVKGQVAQLRSRFPSPEAFNQALAAQGLKEADLVARARDAFLVKKFVETKIQPTVSVTDDTVKAFYDQNQDKMKRPEQVHVRHILIHVDKTAAEADRQKAKAKAEGILAQVKKGEDFGKLATENSDDPGSKAKAGDLSWISRGQTVEPFDKAAFALTKPNEISPLVSSDFGYHIIQLLERRDAGVVPFPEAKDRIATFLKQKQEQEKVQAHIQELRTKAKVEVFL